MDTYRGRMDKQDGSVERGTPHPFDSPFRRSGSSSTIRRGGDTCGNPFQSKPKQQSKKADFKISLRNQGLLVDLKARSFFMVEEPLRRRRWSL